MDDASMQDAGGGLIDMLRLATSVFGMACA
jgi:hypothetical protein